MQRFSDSEKRKTKLKTRLLTDAASRVDQIAQSAVNDLANAHANAESTPSNVDKQRIYRICVDAVLRLVDLKCNSNECTVNGIETTQLLSVIRVLSSRIRLSSFAIVVVALPSTTR